MKRPSEPNRLRRRCVLAASAAAAAAGLAPSAAADPYTLRRRFEELTSGRTVRRGRLEIDLPDVADNGHSVPMSVRVMAPPGQDTPDIVRLVLLSDQNPRVQIAAFEFGPAAAQSAVGLRVRLNGSQRVTVMAQTQDGDWWFDDRWVEVNESACADPTGA